MKQISPKYLKHPGSKANRVSVFSVLSFVLQKPGLIVEISLEETVIPMLPCLTYLIDSFGMLCTIVGTLIQNNL